MQFIINKSVVLNAAEQQNDITLDVLVAFGVAKDLKQVRKSLQETLDKLRVEKLEIVEFKNFMVTERGDDVVVTINDDILRRYMGVVAKVVRALLPIAMLLKSAFGVFKHSVEDFAEWFTAEKEAPAAKAPGTQTVNGCNVEIVSESTPYGHTERLFQGIVTGRAVRSAYGVDSVRMAWDKNGVHMSSTIEGDQVEHSREFNLVMTTVAAE